jgi:radical SAM superfamily enzyme YgiQ (UPF0313 family)
MTRRIVLVAPPYDHSPGPFARLARFAEPPLGLIHLAAMVRTTDPAAAVTVIDAPALGLSPAETERAVASRRPDIVGISTTTLTAPVTRALCRAIKRSAPRCAVYVGGSHPTALPADLLPDADATVIGEGEETIAALVRGEICDGVAGLAFWSGSAATVNPRRPLIPDLDALPFPAYDLLPLDRYAYQYPFRAAPGRYATIVTARGCPGGCAFCAKSAAWGDRVRFHSVDRAVDHVTRLVDRLGVTLLYFYDDTFLARRERAVELAERIGRAGRPLKWICQGRADEVDDAVCAALARAGCVQIEIGIETGDPDILESIGKRIRLDHVRAAFAAARRNGLQTRANFLFGFPDETPATIRRTVAVAREVNPTYANFFHLVPVPGSRYFDLYRRNGWLITTDWGRFTYHGDALVSVPGVSARELDGAKRRALAGFFLRPGKLAELAAIFVRSRDVRTVVRGLLTLLNGLMRR